MSSPERYFIYLLVDPRTMRVRYVGCSIDPTGRLAGHLTCARGGEESRKSSWIRELIGDGARPVVVVIDEASTVGSAAVLEQEWIARLLSRGSELVNVMGLAAYSASAAPAAADVCPPPAVVHVGGREQLVAWLTANQRNRRWLTRSLRASGLPKLQESSVSRWLSEKAVKGRLPRSAALLAIQRITGIPIAAWTADETNEAEATT